jgi:hypothetical protein
MASVAGVFVTVAGDRGGRGWRVDQCRRQHRLAPHRIAIPPTATVQQNWVVSVGAMTRRSSPGPPARFGHVTPRTHVGAVEGARAMMADPLLAQSAMDRLTSTTHEFLLTELRHAFIKVNCYASVSAYGQLVNEIEECRPDRAGIAVP